MSISIQQTKVFLFDFHLCLYPLLDPTLLDPRFSFLEDRAAYTAQCLSGPPIDSPGWILRSLRRELRRNHFWKSYHSILVPGVPPAQPRPWDLQVPFRATPKGLDLRHTQPLARLRTGLFVFPCGWSSNLELTLPGPYKLDDVRATIQDLLDGKPFLIQGKASSLSDVFKNLAQRFRQDFYKKGAMVPSVLKIPRYMVVEILSVEALPSLYDNRSQGSAMSDADRARTHGALLGRQIEIRELVQRERDRAFLYSHLSEGDFVLTYFEHGSLVSLSNSVINNRVSAASLNCLGANVRACSLVAQMLSAFFSDAAEHAPTNTAIDALCRAARAAVINTPKVYTNPFCRGLFANHGSLRVFRSHPGVADPSSAG